MAKSKRNQPGDLFHTVSLTADEVDQLRGLKQRIGLYHEQQVQPNPTTREERTLYWLLRDTILWLDQLIPPNPR